MSTVNVKDTKPIMKKDENQEDEEKRTKTFELKGIDKVLHGNYYLEIKMNQKQFLCVFF